ncbi:glycosyltransferase [bacterium]|nr:glycosyltransferase [bacterium]
MNTKNKYKDLKNLSFAPRVEKKYVVPILKKCDLLYFSVFSSKVWLYGQSLNKVIDYMSAGKPIIASYDGFPSMINEAKCGEFIPAGDSDSIVHSIINYSKLPAQERAEIGERGRRWLFKNRLYKKLAENYYSLIKKNKLK